MTDHRGSRCPLCGATLTATELLDACGDLIDPVLAVAETHCPHCQGYLEVMPANGRVDVGFLIGAKERFDVALVLLFDGLVVERMDAPSGITLTAPGGSWQFRE